MFVRSELQSCQVFVNLQARRFPRSLRGLLRLSQVHTELQRVPRLRGVETGRFALGYRNGEASHDVATGLQRFGHGHGRGTRAVPRRGQRGGQLNPQHNVRTTWRAIWRRPGAWSNRELKHDVLRLEVGQHGEGGRTARASVGLQLSGRRGHFEGPLQPMEAVLPDLSTFLVEKQQHEEDQAQKPRSHRVEGRHGGVVTWHLASCGRLRGQKSIVSILPRGPLFSSDL